MSALLLAPHNDDESLFAAHVCIRENPLVVVVLKSQAQNWQGVTAAEREAETGCATTRLGVTDWEQWDHPDVTPHWGQVEASLLELRDRHSPEVVYAPAIDFEANGHKIGDSPEQFGILHHDYVGWLANDIFENVVHYQTYTRWGGHVREGTRVALSPFEALLKAQALQCYQSQIKLDSTSHHFAGPYDEEWLA